MNCNGDFYSVFARKRSDRSNPFAILQIKETAESQKDSRVSSDKMDCHKFNKLNSRNDGIGVDCHEATPLAMTILEAISHKIPQNHIKILVIPRKNRQNRTISPLTSAKGNGKIPCYLYGNYLAFFIKSIALKSIRSHFTRNNAD